MERGHHPFHICPPFFRRARHQFLQSGHVRALHSRRSFLMIADHQNRRHRLLRIWQHQSHVKCRTALLFVRTDPVKSRFAVFSRASSAAYSRSASYFEAIRGVRPKTFFQINERSAHGAVCTFRGNIRARKRRQTMLHPTSTHLPYIFPFPNLLYRLLLESRTVDYEAWLKNYDDAFSQQKTEAALRNFSTVRLFIVVNNKMRGVKAYTLPKKRRPP